MAMGKQKDRQGDLMVNWSEMPRSPAHVFYDRPQSVLIEGGFDALAEASRRPDYAARMSALLVSPKCYFRMHLVGYFKGIDSERGMEWHCSDSLSLRAFLRRGSRVRVPDHSWLSRGRTRLLHEVHAAVFDRVLVLIAEAARRAVTNNRGRLKSGVAREALKLPAELVERSVAHNLDCAGMRRTWLRRRENVHKRCRFHAAGHHLSMLMRQLIGADTPREVVAGGYGSISMLLAPTGAMLVAWGSRKTARCFSTLHSPFGSESRKKPLNQRDQRAVRTCQC